MIFPERGLSTSTVIWALHSETGADELLNSMPAHRQSPKWNLLRSVGAGYWLHQIPSLRTLAERLAKCAYTATKDPMDAALYYPALRRTKLLANLYKFV